MKREKVQGVVRCLVEQVVIPCVLACSILAPYRADAEIIERIVAVVNEDIITLSELKAISRKQQAARVHSKPTRKIPRQPNPRRLAGGAGAVS